MEKIADYITINKRKKSCAGRHNVWISRNFDSIPYIDVKKGDFFIIGDSSFHSKDIKNGDLHKVSPGSSIVVDQERGHIVGFSGSTQKKETKNGIMSFRDINLAVTSIMPYSESSCFQEDGINLLAFSSEEEWKETEGRLRHGYNAAEEFQSAYNGVDGIIVFGRKPIADVKLLYLSPMVIVQSDTLRNIKVAEGQIPVITIGESKTANLTLDFRNN